MKALVLGVGLQGRAAIHDLAQSPLLDEVVAVDADLSAARRTLGRFGEGKVRVVAGDGADRAALDRLLAEVRPAVVVCMLPPHLTRPAAESCIEARIPYVNTSYAHWLDGLDGPARERGVTVLPEMGFDPGIDLVLGRLAVDEFDEVEGLNSYGAGVPEPAAADNALKYKITWTFEGVLKAYCRPARMLVDGRELAVKGTEIYRPENVHQIQVAPLGTLEAYPNGDALHYIEVFGLGPALQTMCRYAVRWPGHSAYWRIMAEMGFLDDEPVDLGDGTAVSPRRFVARLLTPRLQYREGERDVAVLRVEAWGRKGDRRRKVVFDLVDYRDLATGFFAMNRSVGNTASIGAQLVLRGEVSQPGVLTPVRDVPAARVVEELAARGIRVERRVEDLG